MHSPPLIPVFTAGGRQLHHLLESIKEVKDEHSFILAFTGASPNFIQECVAQVVMVLWSAEFIEGKNGSE